MMIRIAQIVTIVMALTLCNVTHGAEKPNVKVKARIVETSYVAQFSGAARPGFPETPDRTSLDSVPDESEHFQIVIGFRTTGDHHRHRA